MSTTAGSSLYFESGLFEPLFAHEESGTSSQFQTSGTLVLGESVFDKFTAQHPIKEEECAFDSSIPLAEPMLDSYSETTSPAMGTVSPLEIHSSLLDSVFDTAATSELDATPMFEEDLNLDDESKNWVSLFSESEMHSSSSSSSSSTLKRSIDEVEKVETNQQMITPSATPLLDVRKPVDHLGVVSYKKRQRVAPLSPVVDKIDDADPIASKRARNTEAARRSRARKMERMSQLEDKVESLLQRNSDLEEEVKRLRSMLSQ